MTTVKKVAVIAGSLRTGALSKQVALELIKQAPANLEGDLIDISALNIFSQDLEEEGKTPASWTEFREKVKKYDAVLFVTPEHNRSVPAALKNALDVGSRPYGQSIWDGKSGAVVSISPGKTGGFGANHHLRQSLVFLNVATMQQPEAYLGEVDQGIDAAGNFDARTAGFLKNYMAAFGAWVEKQTK